ncbi:MAG TPA: alanine racemase [Burkholderiaceae bacterium]|nr:alanine racemase [Burkholderiaceae bacterium]
MPTLDQVLAETLDASFKGFPPERAPFAVAEAAAQRLNLLRGDLPLPVAVLRESALAHNAAWFGRFVAETGASLCPHGKTTNAPQLFDAQLRDGAWGITVANVHQARLAIDTGAPRVLMANQLATEGDAARWARLARAHPRLRLLTLVDSPAQLALLARGAAGVDAPPLEVLVELGIAGGRTGCRSEDDAVALARLARAEPRLRLAGVEAFEGLNVSGDAARDEALVGGWMRALASIAARCDAEGLFEVEEVVLSAGGSAAYDLVAAHLRTALSRPVRVVLRSGCYLSHDDGMYRRHAAAIAARGLTDAVRAPGPRGALEVWAAVQSRPEPDRAIVTLGRRDVGTDADPPLPLHRFRPGRDAAPRPAPAHWTVFGHNDQHGYLRVAPDDALEVGEWIGFGVSHPCTTFDKWRLVWGVDDDWNVARAIRTYF